MDIPEMATKTLSGQLSSARHLDIASRSTKLTPFDFPSFSKLRLPVSHRQEFSSIRTVTSVQKENGRQFFYYRANRVSFRLPSGLIPGQGDLTSGVLHRDQDCNGPKGRVFYASYDQEHVEDQPIERVSRPPNLEARMRMKAYRRQALSERRNLDMEEEARNIDLDPAKMLKKGDPNTVQAVIRDVMPVGYFLTMPSGREGYLPATDLGTTGGVVLLERLMKVGQELTVRITKSIKTRDIVTIRPEGWVSPVENTFIRPKV